MKKADIGVALYLLAAIIMLIIPISSTVLDVFLAVNIAVAFTLLFQTMYAKEVLELSFYPTILLTWNCYSLPSKQYVHNSHGFKPMEATKSSRR